MFNNIWTLTFNIVGGNTVSLPLHHGGPVSTQVSRAQALSKALAPSMVQHTDGSQPGEASVTVNICRLSSNEEQRITAINIICFEL